MAGFGRARLGVQGLVAISLLAGTVGVAQTAPAAGAAKAPVATPKQQPLQLRSLDPTAQADPFPAVDPKNFTADSPSVATVESYLHTVIGWDANRIWRVEGITKTNTPGVARVVALVAERGSQAKVQQALFYVLPDGKHLFADMSGPQPFGAQPYAERRALLQARANGPARGAASKDLELVEFADLQCERCKDAQATMAKLLEDFPMAHVVFEDFPVTKLHPYSYEAATYGACIAQANPDAFFTYVQAVYETQAGLVPDTAEDTLKAAVAKVNMDPAKVDACSKTSLGKDPVEAATKLAFDLGIEQTPTLVVNGRVLPIGAPGVGYETLRQIIAFQAEIDGVVGVKAPLLTVPSVPSTAVPPPSQP